MLSDLNIAAICISRSRIFNILVEERKYLHSLYLGTFEVERKGPGGEATFYYQNNPCGGMLDPVQLEIHDLVPTTTSPTTPSNESKF